DQGRKGFGYDLGREMELHRALTSETEEFTRKPSGIVAAEKSADQNVGVVNGANHDAVGRGGGAGRGGPPRAFPLWSMGGVRGAQAHLVDDREDVLPGALAGLG